MKALMLTFSLAFSFAGFNQPALANSLSCLQVTQTIYESMAQPGEYKVVYGPYTAHCATPSHRIELRTRRGMRLPVTIEKLQDGVWKTVISKQLDPSSQLGTGTFRVVLDWVEEDKPTHYRGTVKMPL